MRLVIEKLNRLFQNTYCLFPVSTQGETGKESLTNHKKRGISLLIALMTTSLIVGFIADVIVSSAVNVQIASTTKDKVRSEYLAKSGFNLSVFLLSMSWGIDLYRAQHATPTAFKQDLVDSRDSLWNMINSIPPLGATSLQLLKLAGKGQEDIFNIGGIMNEDSAYLMSLFEDQFSIVIEDEGYKINVNDCVIGRCEETLNSLIALFSCPAEKEFLKSKNVNPQELAYRIKDFISKETSPKSGYNDKNTPYLNQTPPYKAKEISLDTVEELRLIDGWDDEIYKVFSPYLTVYPIDNKHTKQRTLININTAPRELLACLVPQANESGCGEKFARKMQEVDKKQTQLAQNTSEANKFITEQMCFTKQSSHDDDTKMTSDNPSQWFGVRSDIFRVVIEGESGLAHTKVTAVIRRIMPREKDNNRDKQKVKRSYEILYWHVI